LAATVIAKTDWNAALGWLRVHPVRSPAVRSRRAFHATSKGILYRGSEVGPHRLDLLVAGFAKPTLEAKRVIVPERPHQDFLASWLP
jgi:hypothetical protein